MNAEAVSLRQSYVDSLIDVGREREDFVVLEADAGGATFINQFIERYPNRHIPCGVAEQNMIGMAAGFSTTGMIPVANTMAVFVSWRAHNFFRSTTRFAASTIFCEVRPNFSNKAFAFPLSANRSWSPICSTGKG